MKISSLVALWLVPALLLSNKSAFSAVSDRDQLIAKFPELATADEKPENRKILCPFHRMLDRAGIYDSSSFAGQLIVSVKRITDVAREFGCEIVQCGTVATAVSAGQLATASTIFGAANLQSLHTALGVSHDCGLSFAKGGREVNDAHRAATLDALRLRQDNFGRLQFEDLMAVKEDICEAQGVRNNNIGTIEMKLIYSFLGGKKRGYIDYGDVELFLNGLLPNTVGQPDGL